MVVYGCLCYFYRVFGLQAAQTQQIITHYLLDASEGLQLHHFPENRVVRQ